MKASSAWRYTLPLLLVLLAPNLVLAEKRYVSDTLIVSLREEATVLGEVIAYLKSGDALEVLQENEEGFLLVKAPNGDQGWIQKKYTIDEKPKDMIIAELYKKIEAQQAKIEATASTSTSLETSSQTLQRQLDEKDAEARQLQQSIAQLKEAVQQAEKRYTDLQQQSQGVTAIVAERDTLLAQMATLSQEAALLRQQNADLVQRDRLLWFLAGFGVFIAGWIMAKVFKRTKKRSLSL